ncbi:hypothetical protein D2Q93_08445 [Alicyclobacillaceae bacterium I2511]|nr:hypothetical protein D2Q93_08445 [Alicyclobacillaceae bacterium I2511]
MTGKLQWFIAAVLTLVTSWFGHPVSTEMSRIPHMSPVSANTSIPTALKVDGFPVTTEGVSLPFNPSQFLKKDVPIEFFNFQSWQNILNSGFKKN